ncbi:MAG: hypothetical protein RLY31_787 [Bacteroidota bacterium]|jgi:outer membrane lipoprotein-sorting protein
MPSHLFRTVLLSIMLLPSGGPICAQTADARSIVQRAEDRIRGERLYAEMKMTIIRPRWQREFSLKSWSLGQDYSMVLITAPTRDKGTAFLKRKKEIWNWQPSIDRSIKLPPSMMSQSWMGSDFTNDDLVEQSSLVEDYTHRLTGTDQVDRYRCHVVELIPKPDAAVVWGKVVMWIETEHYLELKVETYDEEGELVNTLLGKEIRELGGRLLPTRLVLSPAGKPGHQTIVEQLSLDFDTKVSADWFSLENLKRLD